MWWKAIYNRKRVHLHTLGPESIGRPRRYPSNPNMHLCCDMCVSFNPNMHLCMHTTRCYSAILVNNELALIFLSCNDYSLQQIP
jgi:hypothetical protein